MDPSWIYAQALLQWSRDCENHGLSWEAWQQHKLGRIVWPEKLAAPPHVPLAGRTA